ncbi:aegerolysin family protein [Roseixanthobacter glucoisosaccharinicivorans]|uniref:aegerolysin family protein n=1 Tax=Roseixanthobacter glucoisosaccharinicivorans TaxID=3119923 RepID=UPI003728EEBC
MAYAQWAEFTIKAVNCSVMLKNVVHQWGKFYIGSKDNEISPDKLEGKVIKPGDSYTFGACGRENASSGTEGSFDLYDGDKNIGNYYWDCPWGSKTNTSTWTPGSDAYIGQQTGANLNSGALGNITIKVAYLG